MRFADATCKVRRQQGAWTSGNDMPLISRRLQGSPHSVHTVAFKDDGTFYVDLHNFDPHYGPGDYAWTVNVLSKDVPMLRAKVERLAESVPFVRRNDPFAALDADTGP